MLVLTVHIYRTVVLNKCVRALSYLLYVYSMLVTTWITSTEKKECSNHSNHGRTSFSEVNHQVLPQSCCSHQKCCKTLAI